MVYGGLPIFIVFSLVFTSSFAVEPVETAPFLPKNTSHIEFDSPTKATPLAESTQVLDLARLSISPPFNITPTVSITYRA